jgi:hypothetical protein
MPSIVLIEKNGETRSQTFNKLDIVDIYKKCNYRKPDNFESQAKWDVKMGEKKYNIHVYGKSIGKENNINKFEMPPPIDTKLLYGTLAVVNFTNKDTNTIGDISEEEWGQIYEKLYGGFEDLAATAEDDENEIDELEVIGEKYKTKSGYLKDGFVVDDSSSGSNGNNNSNNSNNSTEDEESYDTDNDEVEAEKYINSDDE